MKKLLVATGVLSLAGATFAQAAPRATAPGYAEGVYAEYSTGSGRSVLFSVQSLGGGSLSELAGKRFSELVGLPSYTVEATQVGTEIRRVHFESAGLDALDLSDLEAGVADFEKVGYPMDLGRYRALQVSVAIGAEARTHQALEFCWASLGHCALLDPSVTFLQSMVDNRLRLQGEGWGPRLVVVRNEPADATTAVCGLASNPAVRDRYFYWRAYTVDYKDIFGITLVHKALGAQQSGIRCNTSCQPAPYGYSNASSAYGTLGWNATCDNDFGYGTGGGSGKWIAETRCTHKFFGSATANASVSNLGSLSVAISWSVDGGVDQNGGQILDTCGYY